MKEKIVLKRTQGREGLFDLFYQATQKMMEESEKSEDKTEETKILH
ncbi:hypothetical protein GGQ84_000582 [Desulfitispora alkaliphila]